jgi:hypothetical protein
MLIVTQLVKNLRYLCCQQKRSLNQLNPIHELTPSFLNISCSVEMYTYVPEKVSPIQILLLIFLGISHLSHSQYMHYPSIFL